MFFFVVYQMPGDCCLGCGPECCKCHYGEKDDSRCYSISLRKIGMKLRISIIARTRASFVVIHTACKDSINKVKYRLCHEKNNRELKVHQVLMILERKVKPHESQLEPELRCHPATEIRVWQRRGKERQNEIKSQARRSTVWNVAPGISASLPRQSRNPALLPVTRP